MLRAAALSYAIVFALLIGLLCSGVLFIFATQKKLETISICKEYLLTDTYTAIQIGMLMQGDTMTHIHPSGDTSDIQKKSWGLLMLVHTNTHRGNLRKERSALLTPKGKLPFALYIPGNSGGIKVGNEGLLEGDAYVPNAQVEMAYVGSYTRTKLIFGTAMSSALFLPEILLPETPDITDSNTNISTLSRDSSYSFGKPTAICHSTAAISLNSHLSGNLIIASSDSIFIRHDAQLKDVILIAPRIRFEKGFRGTVQAFASEHIICERDVHLFYPSALVVRGTKEKMEQPAILTLENSSRVYGTLINWRKEYDYRFPDVISIGDSSKVAGLVYCTGQTEVKGTLLGSLLTNQLISRSGGGTYTNQLIGGKISSTRLPAGFLFPALPRGFSSKYKVMKWLKN